MTARAAAAAAVAVAVGGCGSSTTPAPPHARVAPSSAGTAVEVRDRSGEVAAFARRFARPYLRWEVGRPAEGDVERLRAASSPHVAQGSFGAVVRPPLSARVPPIAELTGVRVSRESAVAGHFSVSLLLRREGHREVANLGIRMTARGPQVDQLYPPTRSQ